MSQIPLSLYNGKQVSPSLCRRSRIIIIIIMSITVCTFRLISVLMLSILIGLMFLQIGYNVDTINNR